MKKVFGAIAIISMLGCSPDKEVVQIIEGEDGTSCTVSPELDSETSKVLGARISCTDGSYTIVLNGQDGEDAKSCQAYRVPFVGAFLKCPGQLPVIIKDGKDGEDGKSCKVKQLANGARITCGNSVAYVWNGQDGANGQSCSVTNHEQGALITCGNTSQLVLNGADGAVGPTGPQGPQGEPGENALANAIGIKSYIYPCGKDEFNNDEILLRLTDNNILALYDGGPNEDRLVLLAPGNYKTTDRNGNKQCFFTVTQGLEISEQRICNNGGNNCTSVGGNE